MLIYASVIIKVKNYACAQLNHKCNEIFSKAKKIYIFANFLSEVPGSAPV